MASSHKFINSDGDLAEEPILATVENIEVTEPEDDDAGRLTLFTLTEVDAWVYGGEARFEDTVQVQPLTLPREIQRVRRANGILFDTYAEAAELVKAANAHAEAEGTLAGTWSTKTIGERRIYLPMRKAVA